MSITWELVGNVNSGVEAQQCVLTGALRKPCPHGTCERDLTLKKAVADVIKVCEMRLSCITISLKSSDVCFYKRRKEKRTEKKAI